MRHPRSVQDTRELLIGTWTAIAVVVEVLIECGVIAREEVLEPLSGAEAVSTDRREIAIRGVRLLLERFAEFPAPDGMAGEAGRSAGGDRNHHG